METKTDREKTLTREERRARRREFYEYCQKRRAELEKPKRPPLWENRYWTQEILTASPVECVVKLYDGAIQFLNRAIAAIESNEPGERFDASQRAAKIIEHLLATLDKDQGGDIALKLEQVYMAALKRMIAVDVENSAQAARDVIALLEPLAAAWRELAARQAQDEARRHGRALPADAGAGNPRRSISASV